MWPPVRLFGDCGDARRNSITISCYSRGHIGGAARYEDHKGGGSGQALAAPVHRHGSNLLGGVMVTVMLYAVVLTVLAT